MSETVNKIADNAATWRELGYRYYPLGLAMRAQFGESVWKVSVDAGMTCPNRDGRVGNHGCIFCDATTFSPSRQSGLVSITEQIDHGILQLRRRYRAPKFLAYFQPATNTYAQLERLRDVYNEAIAHKDIVGLVIGTRPDALGDEVLDLLTEMSRATFVQVDVGLQTIHDSSLEWLCRGHTADDFTAAAERLRSRRLRWGVHLIVGLPCETREMICETANRVAELAPDAAKLHHLYVVRDTPLATLWERKRCVALPTLEEYASLAVDVIERLPPTTVIERVAGEASPPWLVAPAWTSQKHAARNAIAEEFLRRNSWQAKEMAVHQ
ncbi:MAG: TIGR01212 family radical SAM protein [Thermoguttaceae bacterium]